MKSTGSRKQKRDRACHGQAYYVRLCNIIYIIYKGTTVKAFRLSCPPMPNDTPTRSGTHRLLLTKVAPPPIPPRLRSRIKEPPPLKEPPAAPAKAPWIDRDEFATASKGHHHPHTPQHPPPALPPASPPPLPYGPTAPLPPPSPLSFFHNLHFSSLPPSRGGWPLPQTHEPEAKTASS